MFPVARAKGEALDNIYSLLKQNINLCNVKRRRQRERWKNNNRSKCTCSTLLKISLLLFCTTTKWNSQKLPSYTFYGGNVERVLVHSFFFCSLRLIFTLVAAWHFSFSHRCYKIFMFFFQQKYVFLCFLSLALALSRSFSLWASLICRLLSLSLCVSLYLYSKFVDMT